MVRKIGAIAPLDPDKREALVSHSREDRSAMAENIVSVRSVCEILIPIGVLSSAAPMHA